MMPLLYRRRKKHIHISVNNLWCSPQKFKLIGQALWESICLKSLLFLCGVTFLSATLSSCVIANSTWQAQLERRKFKPIGRRSCHSLDRGGGSVVWVTINTMWYFTQHYFIPCISPFCICVFVNLREWHQERMRVENKKHSEKRW